MTTQRPARRLTRSAKLDLQVAFVVRARLNADGGLDVATPAKWFNDNRAWRFLPADADAQFADWLHAQRSASAETGPSERPTPKPDFLLGLPVAFALRRESPVGANCWVTVARNTFTGASALVDPRLPLATGYAALSHLGLTHLDVARALAIVGSPDPATAAAWLDVDLS